MNPGLSQYPKPRRARSSGHDLSIFTFVLLPSQWPCWEWSCPSASQSSCSGGVTGIALWYLPQWPQPSTQQPQTDLLSPPTQGTASQWGHWHLALTPVSKETSLSSSRWLLSPLSALKSMSPFQQPQLYVPQWVWNINSVCVCVCLCTYVHVCV